MQIFPPLAISTAAAQKLTRDLRRVTYVEWLIHNGFWGIDLFTTPAPKQFHHLSKHAAWPTHLLTMNRLFAEKRLVRVPTHLKPFFSPSCSINEHDLQARVDAMELGELESPATLKGDDRP